MTTGLRDRIWLLATATGVASLLALVSHASYRLGFDGVGVIVAFETVTVFGAALSYAGSSWPKWYEKRALRGRILVTLLMLLLGHVTVAALTMRQLRAEWGGPVWMAIGLGEILGITVVLGLVTRDVK